MSESSKNPIVIVQGYGAPTITNLPIKLRLEADGYNAFNAPLPGLNTQDIRFSAKIVSDAVSEVKDKTGANKVDLIGVSMGGLISLQYIRKLEGHQSVDKFISLATPFNGTPLAGIAHAFSQNIGAAQMQPGSDFLTELHEDSSKDCKIFSMWVKGDFMVTKDAAALEGAKLVYTPHGVWPLGHYFPIFHPKNYALIKSILAGEIAH